MGAQYYYQARFELKESVDLLAVVQAYDPDATLDDIDSFDPLLLTWSDPHGPRIEFEPEERIVKVLMDGYATVHFDGEMADFLTTCADDFSTVSAILSVEGSDRDLTTYGSDSHACLNLLADYRRDAVEANRQALRRTVKDAGLPMDEATELVAAMRALLVEAITEHIYSPGDPIPANCRYHSLAQRAATFLEP
jgi:hypothetical protein